MANELHTSTKRDQHQTFLWTILKCPCKCLKSRHHHVYASSADAHLSIPAMLWMKSRGFDAPCFYVIGSVLFACILYIPMIFYSLDTKLPSRQTSYVLLVKNLCQSASQVTQAADHSWNVEHIRCC